MRPGDIAEVLGTTPNAIEVRLHRARHRLKEALGPKMDDPRGT
jgi:DNA-directed RNA polymerase specialized sigma24 family protein